MGAAKRQAEEEWERQLMEEIIRISGVPPASEIRCAPCGDPILPEVHDDKPCSACLRELGVTE